MFLHGHRHHLLYPLNLRDLHCPLAAVFHCHMAVSVDRHMHVMIHVLNLRNLHRFGHFLDDRHVHLLLHWHGDHLILVLNCRDLHVFLDGLDNWYMFMPLNRHMDVVVDVLKHRDLDCLRHFLDDRNVPLLCYGNVDDFVNVLNLWNVNGLLNHFLYGDVLNHHLRHFGDVLLDDRFLPLHCPLHDLRLDHLNLLHLILDCKVLHRL
mmetsp:Transcript_20590/g.48009  ORF Transcript_20590/g.48009 Transcript_20590/m.48009 type:complete len:207 (-) Transcript_20590:2103-2723(-)